MRTLLRKKHVLAATKSGAGSGPSYQSVIIADGPAAYWPLDETVAPLRDKIGTRHCTIAGGVTFNQAGIGSSKCVQIAADGQILPPSTFPPLNSAFTLELWYKLPIVNNMTAMLMAQNILTNGDFQWRVGASNAPLTFQYFSETYQTFSWPTSLTFGSWYHFVVTGATRMLFYTNGVQVADNPITAAGAGPGLAGIGCAQDANIIGAQGFLQDVAVYQKVLTPAQVLAHYKNRVP